MENVPCDGEPNRPREIDPRKTPTCRCKTRSKNLERVNAILRKKLHETEASLKISQDAQLTWAEKTQQQEEQLKKARLLEAENSRRFEKDLEKVRLVEAEKTRRLKEQLEQASDAAAKANKQLVQCLKKVNELQRRTESVDENQIIDRMRSLFRKSETWTTRHFPPKSERSAMDGNTDNSNERNLGLDQNWLPDPQYIQAVLSSAIWFHIFSKPMIGAPDELGGHLSRLEIEVERSFPSHIWQHWRSATSQSLANINPASGDKACSAILQYMEETCSDHSVSSQNFRVSQLEDLLTACIDFKKQLERQETIYRFEHSYPDTPFCEWYMRSHNGTSPVNSFVCRSLWPGLYKVTSEKTPIMIEKQLVELAEV